MSFGVVEVRRMLARLASFIALLSMSIPLYSQAQQPSDYMPRATIQHSGGSATLIANSPDPLSQAITAIEREYGWVVNFEGPPIFSRYDTVDAGSDSFRTAHPRSGVTKPGLLRPSGGAFQSTYPESSVAPCLQCALLLQADEKQVLDKIVADYNRSSNPGNFVVRELADGTYSVIGTAVRDDEGHLQQVSPILDSQISIPTGTRDLMTTVKLIAGALTAKTGVKIIVGSGFGGNAARRFRDEMVTIGQENSPARDLLMTTLAAFKKTSWLMFYEPGDRYYFLMIR